MGLRFNPPPNWPPPPPGFVPPPRWQPDPDWPPPPPGWQLWVPDETVAGQPDRFSGRPRVPRRPPEFAAGQAGRGARAGTPAWPDGSQPGAGGFDTADFPTGDFPTRNLRVRPRGFPDGPGEFRGGPPPGGGRATAEPLTGAGREEPFDPPAGPTNGFAVASFVLGLLGFGIILSYVFGVIALRQIRESGQRGRGLAVTGLALSGLWTVLLAGAVFLTVGKPSATPPAAGGAPSSAPSAGHSGGGRPGTTNVFSLQTGQCFQNPPASQTLLGITYVTVTPCTTPHNAQVFVQFPATGSGYPGIAALKREADLGCHSRIAANVQQSKITDTMTLRYLYPLAGSWAGGHRAITCLIVDATPDLRSSLLLTHPRH